MGRRSTARERLVEATIDLLYLESYGGASVDALCERASIKKGSFYHFFKSKDELIIAALDEHWRSRQPQLQALFSPARAPLDRLRAYFDSVVERQTTLAKKYGRPPGCFYCKLGIEAAQGTEIGKKVQDIMAAYEGYYVSALVDAAAGGAPLGDIPAKARALFAFMEGVLTQARIHGNAELLKDLGQQAFRFLQLEKVMAA